MTPDTPTLPSDPPPPPRHIYQVRGFWAVVVFALTFATHAVYVVEIADHPFFNFPLVDSDTYHKEALNIAEHGWVGDRIFWQAPLYPYFLAFCYHPPSIGKFSLGFGLTHARFFDIRIIQALLASISAVLLYRLGRRRIGTGVGVGAALTAAFYGPLIYFDAEMLAPVLIVFFYLLTATALDKALFVVPPSGGPESTTAPPEGGTTNSEALLFVVPPSGGFSKNRLKAGLRTFGWWPLAGAMNALAALAHGMALPIAPLVCLYGLFGKPMRSRLPFAKRLLAVGLYALAVAVIIAPVTIRNYVVGGEFVLISHNGPINMYIGNHPDYDRMVELRPGLEWASLARALNEEGLDTVGGSSRYFTQAMWKNIREHPLAIARVYLKKTYLFFHADELKRNYPIYPVRAWSRLMSVLLWKWRAADGWLGLGFPFGLVLPLAIVGWWALRRRGIRLHAVELIMAGHFLSNLLFFIVARYRVPLAPFLALYAAAAIDWTMRERLWRPDSLRRGLPILAVALAAFLVSNAKLKPMNWPPDNAEYRFHLGYVAFERKETKKAFEYFQSALRDRPDLTEAHLFMGILCQDYLGRPADALAEFDWILARDPGNMPVLYNKAHALDSLGRTPEARAILDLLVRNDPRNEKYRRFLDQLTPK